ncbi:MAG: DUF4350 domain-containing protein [Terriglobales bacterium]
MIRQNRIVIICGIGILVVVTAVAYLESKAQEGDGHPSSYSNLRRGAKAAYLLLQQSGYPVERWHHSPADLPADSRGILLIVAEPVSYPSRAESDAVSRFLAHGGSILAAGAYPSAFTPNSETRYGNSRIGAVACTAAAPTRLTRGGSISVDGDMKWEATETYAVVHFADPKGNAVVVSYPVGNGSVTWWASGWPLENAGIREKNNLELLLNSTSGYKRVLFDEYYQDPFRDHGKRKSIRAYAWALGQFALIGLAIVLTYSRRSGPLVPLAQSSRGSPLEFVETLGGLFQRAGSAHVAVEIAFQRFRQVAARRLGVRGTSNASDIVEAMSQRGIHFSESTANLVRQSEFIVNDNALTERSAIVYVRALNEATRAIDPTINTVSASESGDIHERK